MRTNPVIGFRMAFLFDILRRAALDLMRPRVVAIMFLPMLLALLVWGGLFWGFGTAWVAGLEGVFNDSPLPGWLGPTIAGWVIGMGVYSVLILMLLPAIYLTALFITSLVFMPILLSVVAHRHYPALGRQYGGSNLGSLGNGLYALTIYIVVWLVTLPFWLLGPFGAGIALLLNAWLNQRLFLYDALAEHASKTELATLRAEGGWPLYGLAAFLGLLHLVPVINLFAPIYMGLAFTHYALGQLERLRQEASA
ncbi:MAG: EI24 domain-containing protein [Pseudomonadota bacterium]|nr:EI24 domain-containing protein [Pseudomonadota bacterium]MDP1573166.1 EI24 domain-containing protein [Pseudomonadota bacterium]MDP1905527.1 EI24 domain-containing protein [Pseudomonadota bacterium]